MSTNIVIFGLAHSGKSTFSGYLWLSANKDFHMEKFIRRIKLKAGQDFDPSRYYGYLVDGRC